jgi:photosystem II stability/assembly factor-like uncharacterized protein
MLYSRNSGATWSWRDLPVQSGGVIGLQSGGGKTLLASSERGLYISRDAGTTWVLAAHGLPASPPENIAVTGQVWMASMRSGGLYVSQDLGATWNRAQSTVAEGFFPAISAAETQSSVYAASATEGLFSIEVGTHSAAKQMPQPELPRSPRPR